MLISREQSDFLVEMIATVQPDALDCDGCFQLMAEFVELQLLSREIPEAMRCVERHLEQCVCCRDEYKALLDALQSLSDAPV